MSENWRLWSEIQPAEDTGEIWQVLRSSTATFLPMGVADPMIERLRQDLSETALAVARQCIRTPIPISCQVFVPADWRPGRCGSLDWAYFLVTKTAGGPGLDADHHRVIQVFLYPAVRG